VLKAKYFLLATGSRPIVPDINGLLLVPFYTSDSISGLKELPKSILIIGGGVEGCERAQNLAKSGVNVSLVERGERLLQRGTVEASELIYKALAENGVKIFLQNTVVQIEKLIDMVDVTMLNGMISQKVTTDGVLVCVGRGPNVEGLELEATGVKYTNEKILHSQELQTTRRNIFVVGDNISEAMVAVQNIALPFNTDFDPKVVPWIAFTDPEVAAVGKIEVSRWVRCITGENAQGFIQIFVNRMGKIVGAQLVGSGAGEMVHELALAIECGVSVDKLMGMIFVERTKAARIQQTLFEDMIKSQGWRMKLERVLGWFT
jgi:pyruvate/2-oxoglutarate dehydrogenase complex dihydrolipoamide dehydrogenase (E3) component